MCVETGHHSFITITDYCKIDFNLMEHQSVSEVKNAPEVMVHLKEEHYSYSSAHKWR